MSTQGLQSHRLTEQQNIPPNTEHNSLPLSLLHTALTPPLHGGTPKCLLSELGKTVAFGLTRPHLSLAPGSANAEISGVTGSSTMDSMDNMLQLHAVCRFIQPCVCQG